MAYFHVQMQLIRVFLLSSKLNDVHLPSCSDTSSWRSLVISKNGNASGDIQCFANPEYTISCPLIGLPVNLKIDFYKIN